MRRNLLGEEIVAPPKLEREVLTALLQRALQKASLLDLRNMLTNAVDATLEFARLCAGGEAGQKISLCFNPHRLLTSAAGYRSIFESLIRPEFCSGLARVFLFKGNKETFYQAIQLGVNGSQYINEFPPHVARRMIQRFSKASVPRVLDPCAGWGGRMIGAASVGAEYVAWEPAPETYKGLLQLGDWLLQFKTGFKFHVYNVPYEDAEDCGKFDFALTSPPYYDTEHYSNSISDSAHRYGTFQSWVDGFFRPLILNTMARLKPQACFLLNVGDRRYPLSRTMKQIWPHYEQVGGLAGIGGLRSKEGRETLYCLRRHA